MAVRRTLEQERASSAWQCIQQVANTETSAQQDYRAVVRGFPAMVQLNGLGPACAFLFAKRGGAHKQVLDHLSTWLRAQLAFGEPSLIDWLTNSSVSEGEYRRATVEALAYLLWLRRFAEGALAEPRSTREER